MVAAWGPGVVPPMRLSTAGATSALNLLGKVESWGITTGTQVQDVQLKVASLTGAQLNELLKKLPDGITYERAALEVCFGVWFHQVC